MSVNSKARSITTFEDLLYEFKVQDSLLHALLRDRRGFSASETKPIGTAAGATTAATGMLRTEGDTMIGPLAFFPEIVSHDITDNSINIGKAFNDGYSSRILLSVGPSTVNLDYIHDAAFAGQLLDLQGILTEDFIIRTALRKTITNIVGDGATQIITVTVVSTSDLASGEYVKITGTVNFDIDHVEITVTGGTTFTYDLGSVGSAVAEVVGTMTRGNIRTFDLLPFLVEDNDNYWLVFDIASNEWNIFGAGGATGGGGGISFPIDFPEDDRGTVGASTQIIFFDDADRHSVKMEITGDIELAFSVPPTDETAYSNIIILQDGTGGHTVTLPVGTVNKDIVEAGILLGIDEETGIVIKFAFGIFYAFLETGNIVSGGGGGTGDVVGPASATDEAIARFDGTTGKLIQNSTVFISDLGALSGVTGIDLDGATATIQGVQLLNLFQTDQQIESLSTGIEYSVGDLQSHLFKSQSDNIAQFEEAAANVFRLNMLDHSVRDARDVTLSNASGAAIFAGSSPAIGFDSVAARLLINYPTGASVFVTENNVIDTTQIKSNSIETNIVNALDLLQLGVDVTAPTVPGEFRNDGTDVFAFSGGVARNLSNISTTAAATRELDNLTVPPLINTSLISDTADTDDLGSELIPWRIAHIRQVQFDATSSSPTGSSDTQISRTAALSMEFNAAGAGVYNFFFAGVNNWSLTPTLLTAISAGILIDRSLTFNSSGTNPAGDGELTRNVDSVLLQSPTFQLQRNTTGTFSGDLNLTKVDAAPSGGEPIYQINFNLFDSPTSITYAQIEGGIEDVTNAGLLELNVRADGVSNVNALLIEGSSSTGSRTFVSLNAESRIGSDLKFQAPTGSADLKIFPALNRLGIVQDNVSFTVGDEGTLAMPVDPSLSPTLATLDAAFGTHVGAMGVYDTSAANVIFAIKGRSDEWVLLSIQAGGGNVLGEHINS